MPDRTATVAVIAPMPRSSPPVSQGERCPTKFLPWVLQRSQRGGHMFRVTQEERLRAVFEEHYHGVARFVRLRGHDSADADDIVAGTFEVAWKRMDKLPEGREALPWLLGVARNLSRNARRKSQREASFVDELSAVTVPWAELPIEDRAASAEVMSALAQLKPIDRDLILLVAWDELTPAQAGQVLGLRPVTARSRLHRARKHLNALLNDPAADSVMASSPLPKSAEEKQRGR